MNGSILCTICARGGSKGVPDKNVRKIAGKPLIAHTIEHVQNWEQADSIIVSTDSEEIARVAENYGARIPFLRPDHLATDEAPKIAAVKHAHRTIEELDETEYEFIVDLDPTALIRTSQDIGNAFEIATERGVTEVQSATISEVNPYYNMVEPDQDGFVHLSKNPDNRIDRRQDTPPVYALNGSIAVYTREHLKETNDILTGKTKVYLMDAESEVTIDRPKDLKVAEILLENRSL